MKSNTSKISCKRGFTLIELLVVVLIIGILAAVAVPQYRKAVKKAHIAELMTYITNYYKATDMWLLQNGIPSGVINFTGTNPAGTLDIDFPCDKSEENYCYTKVGRFHVGCGTVHCWVDVATNHEGYTGGFEPSWALQTRKDFYGDFAQQIRLQRPFISEDRKIICEAWATYFGRDRMTTEAAASCAEVGA